MGVSSRPTRASTRLSATEEWRRRRSGCGRKCESCWAKQRKRMKKRIGVTVGIAEETSYRKSCSDGKRGSPGYEKPSRRWKSGHVNKPGARGKTQRKRNPHPRRNTALRIRNHAF